MMIKFELTQEQWESLRDGFADISCWFMGFSAAHIDSNGIKLPPGLEEVSDVVSRMKALAKAQQ